MRWAGFLEELRRRKVFQVAAWYGAGAWLLIQVATTVAEAYALPPSIARAIIAATVAGFPVALMLVWAFDLTSRGIERTPDQAAEPVTGPGSTLPVALALAAGALLGIGALEGWRAFEAPSERPGIAVLPFDTLGESANRVLAGGLHEAVLNELAAVSGLRVIARTSVLRFAEAKPDLREVGRILDVPFVLEGSVIRDGARLRVHAQLIEASSNAHIWSASYDRRVDDLFEVQSALARDIVRRLKVTLLHDELERAARAPTADAFAYQEYLHGLDQLTQARRFVGDTLPFYREALRAFDAALSRDPAFAAAQAGRSEALISLWYHYRDVVPDLSTAREVALLAATDALRRDPGLGEGHRALGLYYYWGQGDNAKAEREFQRARELLPNDGPTHQYLSFLYRRMDRIDEMIEVAREGVRVDPGNAALRGNLVWNLLLYQRYAELDSVFDDLLARFPEDQELIMASGIIGFCRSGDPDVLFRAGARLDEHATAAELEWVGAMAKGEHSRALASVSGLPDSATTAAFEIPLARAIALRAAGEPSAAANAVAQFIRDKQREVAERPNGGDGLAVAYLLAGRGADAVVEAKRFLAANEKGHRMVYWNAHHAGAIVLAHTGAIDEAFEMLRAYQEGPRGMCGPMLRHHAMLAPLRKHPEFETLARQSDWPTAR
jgi:serine/threonine-protein kinase